MMLGFVSQGKNLRIDPWSPGDPTQMGSDMADL